MPVFPESHPPPTPHPLHPTPNPPPPTPYTSHPKAASAGRRCTLPVFPKLGVEREREREREGEKVEWQWERGWGAVE